MRIIGNAGKAREVQAVASGALSTGDTVVVNADGTVSAAGFDTVSTSFGADSVFYTGSTKYHASVYDPVENKVVIFYEDVTNSGNGKCVVGTVSGNTISFSSPQTFESGPARYMRAAYDAASGNIVVYYQDVGNSNYGTAIVGALSGTSLTFGSPVVFSSAWTIEGDISYDSTASKIVIAWRDYGNLRGVAIVGTVSGTSISFGAASVFDSTSGGIGQPAVAYDVAADKTVVFYNRDNSPFNPEGRAIVGTISGTSISFGTNVQFANKAAADLSLAYDSNSQKVVASYRDAENSDFGRAIVGTVEGTSISVGSEATYNSGFARWNRISFDENVGRIVVAFRQHTATNNRAVAVGTVSGTSITFDSPVLLSPAGETADWFSLSYNSVAKKMIVSYGDKADGDKGTALVMTTGGDVPNLTSDNYIGTAATGAPDGQGAKINIKGAVDENQSGLTAGQSYYVQTDGTLGTTPASPSVFAGTAVAANKLIVKG